MEDQSHESGGPEEEQGPGAGGLRYAVQPARLRRRRAVLVAPDYIQHSAHIAPGREGLFDLVRSLPPTLKYEPGVIVADGDFVIVHGRFSGFGAPVNWIAADILRIQDGLLVEHRDVIQDEATQEQSRSGRPMFGDSFPVHATSEKTTG
jgi:predicted SnoaL-like aldol condensation-catalyzing enzyme